ncbi:helix-turn-helix domain-containing protein [Fibrivirga algicola]|uniref:Helix-turn-helix domain-containing protein n=1 Tax=Fibrivirga algicola TaxID=2950420 RepID=A0ABX0QGL0_9BACT|nr:helix-turn-helix domain-containing protein [Fibrivirga algicola]NID11545.1 helix-turn-helix domain-containing protein [Fibrivirga algicola]
MHDLNDLQIFLGNVLRPIVYEAVKAVSTPSAPTPVGAEQDELLTPGETAKLLKVSKVTVWDWTANRGILTKHTIGNQVRYLKSEVLAAVTKKQVNHIK